MSFLDTSTFEAPAWAQGLNDIPSVKVSLGRFPTPIHKFQTSLLKDLNINWWIKRDDMSGFDMGGNKVRKLEFLMADAVAKGADCVVTIGGIQSNHARATAMAARYLQLEPYLILRTDKSKVEEDPGITGNLMFLRMTGSNIRTVSKEAYNELGGDYLLQLMAAELTSQGKKPYVIPMGGSNSLGTWGYINAVDELKQQLSPSTIVATNSTAAAVSTTTPTSGTLPPSFDHIAFACGSGGTAAGIGLGCELSGIRDTCEVHAVGVCDSPEFFRDFIHTNMHIPLTSVVEGEQTGERKPPLRDVGSYLNLIDGAGLGYAMTTDEEMDFVCDVSSESGVILDPVYSGKALYSFVKHVEKNPESFRGKNILFWHTGGALGLYDKETQIMKAMGHRKQNQQNDVKVQPMNLNSQN